MDLTLIICTYNRADSLKVTLNSLKTQLPKSFNWEIIVVDNADDVNTQEAVKSFDGLLPISLIIEKKAGQNSARNAAIPHINGELVVFTDDDITPETNWLQSLVEAARENSDIDVFGGKIIPIWKNSPIPWQANAWFSSFVYADQDLGEKEVHYKEGCYPSSPNMAIRKKIFDAGVLFNPKIGPIGNNRISGSESEFLSRVLNTSRGLYVPAAQVLHRITNNMLGRGYLRKRCYTMGLGMSVWESNPTNEANLPKLFGVARYRIGRLLKSVITALFFQIQFKEEETIKAECQAALDLGFCIGTWKKLKKTIN
jgi:glycosyltransferase involved in cell wall biosynthesis